MMDRYLVVIFGIAISALTCSISASAQEYTTRNYPVISVSPEAMRSALLAGERRNDDYLTISTASIEYAYQVSVPGCIRKECASNTKLTGSINLKTGEAKVFIELVHEWVKPPEITSGKIFIDDRAIDLTVTKKRETSYTEPMKWTRICNKFTGCMMYLMGGGTRWTYYYNAEISLDLLQDFAKTATREEDHIKFWLGKKAYKAVKESKKEKSHDMILFRNQAIALVECVEQRQREVLSSIK